MELNLGRKMKTARKLALEDSLERENTNHLEWGALQKKFDERIVFRNMAQSSRNKRFQSDSGLRNNDENLKKKNA